MTVEKERQGYTVWVTGPDGSNEYIEFAEEPNRRILDTGAIEFRGLDVKGRRESIIALPQAVSVRVEPDDDIEFDDEE